MSHRILGIYLTILDSKDGGEIDLYMKLQTLKTSETQISMDTLTMNFYDKKEIQYS